ncbi:hypothetical protein FHR70_004622 [Microvirga lupini]|uniref:Secreted protein n=1 Tax=Microvirga lupini TaxID=420324 RepID=A0A7W4VQQ9_9HYPH|nr:hypothetical protein [Microvirga lupini]MBB3021521.1 hypothetical protein [Microvirga lupini]
MQRYLRLAVLSSLITAIPASAQDREGSRLPSGEIRIPSGAAIDRMLDRNAVPDPAKDFSGNDATAIQQMDEQDRKINREVEKGICPGC